MSADLPLPDPQITRIRARDIMPGDIILVEFAKVPYAAVASVKAGPRRVAVVYSSEFPLLRQDSFELDRWVRVIRRN